MRTGFFSKIIGLFVIAVLIFVSMPPTALTAPRDELLMLLDFGEGYETGRALIGQPAGAALTWIAMNSANTNSTVEEPKPPYDNVRSGNVVKLVQTGGQAAHRFTAQRSDVTVKGRVFLTSTNDDLYFGLYHYTIGTPFTQLRLNKGTLMYTNDGGGASKFSNFVGNPTYTIPAGGSWVNFEIRAFMDDETNEFNRVEYYFTVGDTAPVKLDTDPDSPTYRTKYDSLGRVGIQVGANTLSYLDYIEIWQSNLLDPLPSPGNLKWDGSVLSWSPVEKAVSYRIMLYKGGKLAAVVPAENEPAITATSYNLNNAMRENGFGVYTATVVAVARPKEDKDSLESDSSPPYIFENINPPLGRVAKPMWDGNIITWQAEEGAVSYIADLYKGAVRVSSAAAVGLSYDFESEMLLKGKGMYKARVRAVADPRYNSDGEASEFSDFNNFDPDSESITPTDENYCIMAAKAVTEQTLSTESNGAVTRDLTLPASGLYQTSITWKSENPEVIEISGLGTEGYTGRVTRPKQGRDALVTLTATFTRNGYRYEKMYKFIVKSLNPEYEEKDRFNEIVYRDYSYLSGDDLGIFKDVDASHWAKNYIEYLFNKGIVSGTPEGNYEPDRTIKKEEICKILVNLLGFTGGSGELDFMDVSQKDWFFGSVLAAYSAGIAQGVSKTEFGTGADISRQDLAVMIHRTIKFAGIQLNTPNENVAISDEAEISDYARESIEALYKAGVLSGDSSGRIDPLRAATRAEAAKLICILYMLMQ